jgi:hypothetical protein
LADIVEFYEKAKAPRQSWLASRETFTRQNNQLFLDLTYSSAYLLPFFAGATCYSFFFLFKPDFASI